ncbi:MAG: chitobiase/beta-hexosaminidase C-terminal domain-containing protein [Prevotella sp.]|nr:chitobiase/beta-hexosaminidase C-terminal domain-containing protein [Prevotella sp.]
MTKKIFLTLVVALLTLGGSMKAETVEEDFDFSVTCNDGDWAASGVSEYCNLTGGKGTKTQEPVLNSGTMRIYGTNTLTFTAKNEGWTLKSITFSGVSNPTLSASEGAMSDNVWTGSTATVTFTNTGSTQVKPTGIHVVYEKPASVQTVNEDWNLSGTVSQSQPSWSAVDPAISSYVDVKGAQGTGSQAPSLGSTRLRLFSGNTLTISVKDTKTSIKSLAFTFYSSTQTPKNDTEWTVSAGTFDYDNGTWSAGTEDVKEIVITNKKSSQLSFTAVKAVYTAAGGDATLSKPTFSPIGKAVGKDISASDIVDDEQTIEISAAEGASIYYTLDGTTPTAESTLYTEAIVIKNSCTISAIAVKGEQTSDVVAYRYFIHKHDADAFYYESFDGTAYWGGNDGDFNPNMQYSSSTLMLDNQDATYNGCVAVEQAIFLNGGTFQTPTFSQPVKQGTLTFRVAGRTTGNTTVNVTASAGTLSVESVTAKAGQWTDYTIIASNMPAGAYIQFDGTGFLDEIKLVSTAEVEKPTVTIGATGYATFCYGEPLLFPEEVKVYAAYIMADGYVKLEEIVNKDVPANTGVILVAAPGEYELDYTGDITNATTEVMKLNDLKAATEEVTTLGIYVMAEVDGKVGFHPMESGKLEAGRAYLEATDVEEVIPAGTRFIAIEGTDLPTGISYAKSSDLKSQNCYDLQGRRAVQPTKGLYIVGGKKVVR